MSSTAKNLEAITKAIEQHNRTCQFDATAVAMSPFEHERLGWDEIKGVPIIEDDTLGSGSFRIVCERHKLPERNETVDAVSPGVQERERERVPA